MTGDRTTGPGPADFDRERTELAGRLATLETRTFGGLAGVADAAEDLRVRATERGWSHEAGRARLLLADVAARSDRIEHSAQEERDILVEAMLAGDELLAARAHHLLGASLDRLGLLTEALAHSADGVRLLPADAPAHLRVAHTMNLALMSSQQLSGNGFRSSFDQVVADARRLPDPTLLLAALNNYAWLLYERGETDDAARTIEEMETVAEQSGVRLSSAALDTVARVMLDRGDLDRAERTARAAIAPDTPSSSMFNAGEAMLTLAEIRGRRGDADGAYTLVLRAEELGTVHHMAEIRALALRQKSRLLAERGDFRDAYEAATAFHDLWETVRSRETDSRAVLLQTVLNTDEARRRSRVYEELAERDPLTGLWNRRHLDRLLPALVGEHDAGGVPLAVAIVDVDRFKSVNDDHNHQVGDAALCRVADLLRVDEPGFTVRLGGDEFLLVLPGLDEDAALELGEATRSRIAAEDWAAVTGGLSVTVSIGVAASGSAAAPSTLLGLADQHMYRAKRSGRNRVVGSAVTGEGGESAGDAVRASLGRPFAEPRHRGDVPPTDRTARRAGGPGSGPRHLRPAVGEGGPAIGEGRAGYPTVT